MNQEVIFLIDSKSYNKDLMRISLEKLTNCKVYNFFSLDEATLYSNLKPKAIIYSSDSEIETKSEVFSDKVSFIDITSKINQLGKNILARHTSMGEKIQTIINNSNLN